MLMSESDFPHTMSSHEPGFVHVARDAVYPALRGVLPCKDIPAIPQDGLLCIILGDEELIAVELIGEVAVIEALVGVDERLLMVFPLQEVEELMQRVAELGSSQSACCLYVNHRH